jgi:putative transcriptional regulator
MFDDLKKGLSEIDAFLGGKRDGYKVTLPTQVDVRHIRKGLHMTQAQFSDLFGFSLDAIKHWEGGRRLLMLLPALSSPLLQRNPRRSLPRYTQDPRTLVRAGAFINRCLWLPATP